MTAPVWSARLDAHCRVRLASLGLLLSGALARSAAWQGSAERMRCDATQRQQIDAHHRDQIACLTARQDWLEAFIAAARTDAAGALTGALACAEGPGRDAGTPRDPAASVILLARADEARRAIQTADALAWAAVLARFRLGVFGGPDAA